MKKIIVNSKYFWQNLNKRKDFRLALDGQRINEEKEININVG